jgi:phosphatidylglycerophosphate synthase
VTEGERWARDALAELRAARFEPAAVGRFLAASRRRAAETRAARPAVARQARRWSAVGAAAWAAPAALGVQPLRRRAVPGLAWWGLTALMLDWHLGMVETEDGEPRPLGPADALTLARAWLVPLAAERPGPLVCFVAFASDGLDGALARRTRTTRAGRDLEGVADVAFAAAALRGAVRCGGLSRGPAAIEATRMASGVALSWASYLGRGEPPDAALRNAARATTPVRIAGLAAAGLGRRRIADALVTAGALAGLAASSTNTKAAWREAASGRAVLANDL